MGLAVMGALAAAVLWAWGMRGRYVGAFWCRACRRELVDAASSMQRCPHCDADLGIEYAVGCGRRVRRPAAIGAAVCLAWAATSLFAVRSMSWLREVDWQSFKPAGVLIGEARSGNWEAGVAAIDELLRRNEAGELSASRQDELVDVLFEELMPGEWTTKRSWVPLLESRWRGGQLDEQRTLALARYLSHPDVYIGDEPIRQGTFLRFSADMDQRRGAPSQNLFLSSTPIDVTFDETPCRAWLDPHGSTSFSSRGRTTHHGDIALPILAKPGEHTLESTWRFNVILTGEPEMNISWTQTIKTKITTLEPGPDSVDIVADQEASDRMRASTSVALAGIRGLDSETGRDVILGVVDPTATGMRFKPQYEMWLGSQIIPVAESGRPLLICIPIEEAQRGEAIRIIMHPTPMRSVTLPGRERDRRPIWFGPPITFECEPVTWYDSIEDDRIPETIRTRPWDTALRHMRLRDASPPQP